MKRKLFVKILRLLKYREGEMLKWNQVIFHFILFPLDTIAHRITSSAEVRYDMMRDTVHFHGREYTGILLDSLEWLDPALLEVRKDMMKMKHHILGLPAGDGDEMWEIWKRMYSLLHAGREWKRDLEKLEAEMDR